MTWRGQLKRSVKLAMAALGSPDRRPGVLILIYHKVGSPVAGETNITADEFRRQMEYLAEAHTVLPLPDALRLAASGTLERDAVVLTFDDGYAHVPAHAYPVLAEYRLPATVFVCPAYVPGGDLLPWERERSERVMNWGELKELVAGGLVRVGSHTWSHRVLPGASDAEMAAELSRSRAAIEDALGLPVPDFCYPKALYDPRSARAVGRHYETAVVGGCRKNHPPLDPLRLTRVPVVQSDTFALFRAKVTGQLQSDGIHHGPKRLYFSLTGRWPSY